MPKLYVQEIKNNYNYPIEDDVLDFAFKKHKNQFRKDGEAYIIHPLKVVNRLLEKGIDDRQVIHAALCHDIIEDECASHEELKEVVSEYSYQLILLLTKERKESTRKYLRRVKKNKDAFNIKMADRVSNLSDSLNTRNNEFISSYYRHTKQNYLKLTKNTIWDDDIKSLLNIIEQHLVEGDG